MRRDYHDMTWGGVLVLAGLAVAGYAWINYDLGSIRRMGPGFFPVALGLLLAALGALIVIPSARRPGQPTPFAWVQAIGVIGALLAFGLLLDRLGILLTSALTVLISSAVAPRQGIVWRLALTVAVTGLVWLVFVRGLNMSLPIWPEGVR